MFLDRWDNPGFKFSSCWISRHFLACCIAPFLFLCFVYWVIDIIPHRFAPAARLGLRLVPCSRTALATALLPAHGWLLGWSAGFLFFFSFGCLLIGVLLLG